MKSKTDKLTLKKAIEQYTREDIIELMMVHGYSSVDLMDKMNIINKMDKMRILNHFKIPKTLRTGKALYNFYSVAFGRYVNYLGLNSGEVARLVNLKIDSYEDYRNHVKIELRLINENIRLCHIVRFRTGKARVAKHFMNRYFLAPAIDGGFSLKDLCRLTWFTPKIVKEKLVHHKMLNFYQALEKNNDLILPEKPAIQVGKIRVKVKRGGSDERGD